MNGNGTFSVNGITKKFGAGGHQIAVNNVSFDVGAGELVALIGASGSGKTTTLRIAAGYEVPDSGTVSLNGNDVTKVSPQHRDFGMVFQHYALFPHLSVEENVAFGLEARGVSRSERLSRARDVLTTVGLGDKSARQIQALSGGEQQRVALARALVINPKVLLLDEPLSNLDPTLRVNMRDELRSILHRAGVPALLVTHDQEDAFAVADRLVLLKHGKVLQIGTPEELYSKPVSREVAEFIGRAAIVPAEVLGISGSANQYAVLRPESLEIASDGWKGKVTNRRFAGSNLVYTIALEKGFNVEVASNTHVNEGDTVSVKLRDTSPHVPMVPA